MATTEPYRVSQKKIRPTCEEASRKVVTGVFNHMDNLTYEAAIAEAVAALPIGSRRLRAGEAGKIARAYGKPVPKVRKDAERLAKRRNNGRAL